MDDSAFEYFKNKIEENNESSARKKLRLQGNFATSSKVDFVGQNSVETFKTSIIDGLNEHQKEAVTYDGKYLLVIAGAGSGKTRVLTHRIANIISSKKAKMNQILAITFTNKAAQEMRERLKTLLKKTDDDFRYFWVQTFHGACLRILRETAATRNASSNIVIYDTNDSKKLMKRLIAQNNDSIKETDLLKEISSLKNKYISVEDFKKKLEKDDANRETNQEVILKYYEQYQAELIKSNAYDFDDLLFEVVKILETNKEIRQHYQKKFKHILIDEYQDTNYVQYLFVRFLTGIEEKTEYKPDLTVVGDSDQSIYAFRGATIRNINDFEKDYKNAKVVFLEQNYRSSQNILDLANQIINGCANKNKYRKNLWSDNGKGKEVIGYVAKDDRSEASYIAENIEELRYSQGIEPGKIAIIYRTNVQSRVIEDALHINGIPYKIVRGLSFYERAEIKDVFAYMKLILNPHDSVSFFRVLNVPKRKIGTVSEKKILDYLEKNNISCFTFLENLDEIVKENTEFKSVYTKLKQFYDLIVDLRKIPNYVALANKNSEKDEEFSEQSAEVKNYIYDSTNISEIYQAILDKTKYLEYLSQLKDEKDESKTANVLEIKNIIKTYNAQNIEPSFGDFMSQVALFSDTDSLPVYDENGDVADKKEENNCVLLMTIHTCKGLEFDAVFLAGFEEGLLPSRLSIEDGDIEEERRLAYVAITRAKQQLFITRANYRFMWGHYEQAYSSSFLEPIPKEMISWSGIDDTYIDLDGDRIKSYRSGGYNPTSSYRRNGASNSSAGYQDYYKKYSNSSYDSSSFDDTFFDSQDRDFDGYNSFGSSSYKKTSVEKDSFGAATTRDSFTSPYKKLASSQEKKIVDLCVGDRVMHKQFGVGVVLNVEGEEKSSIAEIKFEGKGVKRLMLRFAPLKKI